MRVRRGAPRGSASSTRTRAKPKYRARLRASLSGPLWAAYTLLLGTRISELCEIAGSSNDTRTSPAFPPPRCAPHREVRDQFPVYALSSLGFMPLPRIDHGQL